MQNRLSKLIVISCIMTVSFVAQNCFGRHLSLPVPHITATPKSLSLQEAVLLALRYNPNVKSAKLDRVEQKFSLAVNYYAFEPHLSLQSGAVLERDSKPNYTLNPGVSYDTPFGTELSADFNNQLVGNGGTGITFRARQHLLRGFGTKIAQASLYGAENQEKINQLDLQQTVMDTVSSVISSYLRLVQDYNQLQTLRIGYQNSLVTLDEYRKQIKAGRFAPRSIIQQQAAVKRQKLALAAHQNTISQDTQQLLTVIGLRPETNIEIDKTLHAVSVEIPNLESSKRLVLQRNTAYQAALIRLAMLKRELLVAKDNQRWQLDLTAAATMKNSKPIEGIGPDDNALATSNRNIGLELNIPIGDLPRKQELINAQVNLEKFQIYLDTYRQQLLTDAINATNNIKSLQDQIQLAENTAEYSQQSYLVEKTKWRHRLSSSQDLNSSLSQAVNDKLSVINLKISYLNTITAFDNTLGVLLDKWDIKILSQVGAENVK